MAEEKNVSLDNSPQKNGSIAEDWAESMKEAMEEYIEEQGIYIRQ